MLTQLSVQNFAIVRFLELDLNQGMTTITGETGAGKSIAIDALGLCLGNRAEASMVRQEADKAEISAQFDVSNNQRAQLWLQQNELLSDDECILRRVVTKEGRSKAYINGTAVPLAQLKSLGQYLVSIHGQHAHQLLLKPNQQLSIVDQYAAHPQLIGDVKQAYQGWKALCNELELAEQQQKELAAQRQLLDYQVKELDAFSLQEGEYQDIEQQHQCLSHSTELQQSSHQLTQLLGHDDQVNVTDMLSQACKTTSQLLELDPKLETINNLLHDAQIQVEEATQQLGHYSEQLDYDPELFAELEERMSLALELARKHHTSPEQLPALHQDLLAQLTQLSQQSERFEHLADEIESAWQHYLNKANKLSKSRERAANSLSKQITKEIHKLSMAKAQCEFSLQSDAQQFTNANGIDRVELLVRTNPGQPMQAIEKVASGGELSRIGLAIQVICSASILTPTLIFDEVDVGISGPTAAVVGGMLRQLGKQCQVMCVTHLPQVAGHGHQQMLVSKQQKKNETITNMQTLNGKQRLEELARLLAGDAITPSALANAQELLIED
ncbi:MULTISPECIES: DNA repair protein RecN [unclassified Agarivorans]|uniref:DNA repair protein RecN n=1 Tax=unclassified Agarivorans TaxID=2636026 RepID=UPI0026E2032A|nr:MULTISPECIES: DNA repair protein RecN [unclassified Agarivorans]MDO6684219.1 DNA repair protein RecN [Agarivorans sp. 3_MG-2023]MDO6714047.1 DNA repair protein RecN [Agarivorans sp. 2_MG-2023]